MAFTSSSPINSCASVYHRALVRCLALGGKLYLLDEPFTGIDPERTQHLMAFLKTLPAPVLLSSHESQVLSLADQVVRVDGFPLRIL